MKGGGEGRVVGAVLAGGASRRMGEPKATIELAGRPLIAYPLAAVDEAGLDPIVVAKPSSPLPDLDCQVIREPVEPLHPLAGILAALGGSGGRPVVAVACDMPFVTAELLAWMGALDAAAAICEVGEHKPLLGRFEPRIAAELEPALARGDAVRDAVAALDLHVIDEEELRRFGDPERLCFNVNEPADLSAAERLLAGERGG
jgi:molybdopterin-guanine dinucleotide biosynthesis protein A